MSASTRSRSSAGVKEGEAGDRRAARPLPPGRPRAHRDREVGLETRHSLSGPPPPPPWSPSPAFNFWRPPFSFPLSRPDGTVAIVRLMSPNLRIASRFLTAKKRAMLMSLSCIVLGVGLFVVTQATTSGFRAVLHQDHPGHQWRHPHRGQDPGHHAFDGGRRARQRVEFPHRHAAGREEVHRGHRGAQAADRRPAALRERGGRFGSAARPGDHPQFLQERIGPRLWHQSR